MKKLLFVALLATSLVNAKDNLAVNPVKKLDKSLSGKLEYVCCTKSATATVSDGKGNSNSVTRTEEACVNNGLTVAETMATACELAQTAASQKAILSLKAL